MLSLESTTLASSSQNLAPCPTVEACADDAAQFLELAATVNLPQVDLPCFATTNGMNDGASGVNDVVLGPGHVERQSTISQHTNHHPMLTRRKMGIHKPKVYFADMPDDEAIPDNIHTALESPKSKAAVMAEYDALQAN
ncbi:hypothetical protein V6N11_077526 [Hibiscus sabdariffa]|uniref:Uncharacterized protein n=1 Tax=Hibiscus sabdariffa TaxID=183260 RepID=A0ABR2TDD1_9ROSI